MITLCYLLHPEPEKFFEKEIEREIKRSKIFLEECSIKLSPKEYDKQIELRREISDGITPLERSPLRNFGLARIVGRILFGTKKRWLLERSPISEQEEREFRDLYFKAHEEFYQSNLELCLSYAHKAAGVRASQHLRRDEKLAGELISLQRKNPGEQIFAIRGTTHTLLRHLLAREKIELKVIFPYKNFVYDEWHETIRRKIFRKRLSDLTLLKSFATELAWGYYTLLYYPFYESLLKAKEHTQNLTLEKIRGLSSYLNEKWWKRRDKLGDEMLYFTAAQYLGLE
jgi:hypothetical protein